MLVHLCILANSIKSGMRCIAGFKLSRSESNTWDNEEEWIRPLWNRPSGAISREESMLQNLGREPKLFDIVKIKLKKAAQVSGQPEDWYVDPNVPWEFVSRFDAKTTYPVFEETPLNLWLENSDKHDRVTPEWITQQQLGSLYYISLQRIVLFVRRDIDYGKAKWRYYATFNYRGFDYTLSLTDPVARVHYFGNLGPNSTCEKAVVHLGKVAVCVSLATAWKGELASSAYHYKLVASIIEL